MGFNKTANLAVPGRARSQLWNSFNFWCTCWLLIEFYSIFMCFFSVPYQTSSLSSGWTNALIDKTKMAKVQSSAVGPIITVGILGIKCIETSTIARLPTFHQTLSHFLQLIPPPQGSNLRMSKWNLAHFCTKTFQAQGLQHCVKWTLKHSFAEFWWIAWERV